VAQKTVLTENNAGRGIALNLITSKFEALPSTDIGNALKLGTDNLLYAPSGIHLPIPRIHLVNPTSLAVTPLNPGSLNMSAPIAFSGGSSFTCNRIPVFSSSGIDDKLLDPALDLRLELGWYRKASNRKKTGWHHPTHDATTTMLYGEPIAPTLPASQLRGGDPIGCSEWSITQADQSFIIGNLAQYFREQVVVYRDVNGNENQLLATYIPRYAARIRGSASNKSGRTFAYNTIYRPNYFAFRFSTANATGVKGQRNEGPWSKTVAMSHSEMPFQTDDTASKLYGKTCAAIAPGYVDTEYNCWFATRLPG